MEGSDRGKISGATPAPWDARHEATRRTMQGASATSGDKAVRPGRDVPSGCPWAGHLPCRPSAACPPARMPRVSSNLLRPRVQRAESLPAARASDAEASEGRCWNHRMSELTKSGARPTSFFCSAPLPPLLHDLASPLKRSASRRRRALCKEGERGEPEAYPAGTLRIRTESLTPQKVRRRRRRQKRRADFRPSIVGGRKLSKEVTRRDWPVPESGTSLPRSFRSHSRPAKS
jgi:hypothetical protein